MRNALLAIAILAGCAEAPPAFRPMNPTAETQGGEPAIAVELRGEGHPFAHVLLRSTPAREGVRVVVEILNVGPRAVAFDATAVELRAFDRHGAPLPAPRLATVAPRQAGAATVVVAPATAQTIAIVFVLPAPAARVHDVLLRWALVGPDGERHVQDTRFTRDAARRGKDVAHEPAFMVN